MSFSHDFMRNSSWFTWPGPLATDFPSGQQPYSKVWQGQPEYPGPSAGVKLSGQHLCWVATQPQPEQIKIFKIHADKYNVLSTYIELMLNYSKEFLN